MAWFKKVARRLAKQEGGFTLVELLVVVAILGILAAVVVPNFTNLITNSQASANQADAAAVQAAIDTYMSDRKLTSYAAGNLTANTMTSDTTLATYFRTPQKCNYTVASDGKVTQGTCP